MLTFERGHSAKVCKQWHDILKEMQSNLIEYNYQFNSYDLFTYDDHYFQIIIRKIIGGFKCASVVFRILPNCDDIFKP